MLRKKLNLPNEDEKSISNEETGASTSSPPKKPRLNSENDSLELESEPKHVSKYFSQCDVSISQTMVSLSKSLNNILENISFIKPPICYVYNPTIYASDPCEKYLHLYCNTQKKIIFLGMNPGPWGMCQTGVPFGEINSVRDWLKIEGLVKQPENMCNQRIIEGFNCKKKEVSGDRFWNFFKKLCGTPDVFFKNAMVYNYCPIALMKKDGCNITPADMEISLRNTLEDACDKTLIQVITLLRPEVIVGIGRYAEKRAKAALKGVGEDIKLLFMHHPSPRSPNNNNWPEKAENFLNDHNLTQYFQ